MGKKRTLRQLSTRYLRSLQVNSDNTKLDQLCTMEAARRDAVMRSGHRPLAVVTLCDHTGKQAVCANVYVHTSTQPA